MVTKSQKFKGARAAGKPTRWKSKLFGPQRKRVCRKLWTRSPKKPNSATRQVATVRVSWPKAKNIQVYIPGEGEHGLNKFSEVLLQGGRRKDLPGIKYKAIHNKLSFRRVKRRKTSRSKYGLKKKEMPENRERAERDANVKLWSLHRIRLSIANLMLRLWKQVQKVFEEIRTLKEGKSFD